MAEEDIAWSRAVASTLWRRPGVASPAVDGCVASGDRDSPKATITPSDIAPATLCHKQYEALFGGAGLQRISDGRLSAAQCAYLLRQYDHYVAWFPRLLGLVMYRVSSELVRYPLVRNALDEHGGDDQTKNHRDLYRRLLGEVACANQCAGRALAIPIGQVARRFVAACEDALIRASEPFALGFIGPGTEGTTPELYRVLSNLLRPFSPRVVDTFFTPHAEIDLLHTAQLLPAVEYAVSDIGTSRWHEFVRGTGCALEVEGAYWECVVRDALEIPE